MSAFETLGLGLKLVISDEEIREAFRVKAAVLHPDSGGDESEFARLREAQNVMLSPARRLKEWIAACGLEVDSRGPIEGALMDLFQKVSEAGAAAEQLIRENDSAKSALVKAMAEVKLIKQRELIQELLQSVVAELEQRAAKFQQVEEGQVDPGFIMRDLIFLEKWHAALRGIYGRLM